MLYYCSKTAHLISIHLERRKLDDQLQLCGQLKKNGTYEKRSGVMSQHFSANEFDTLGKSGGVTFNRCD